MNSGSSIGIIFFLAGLAMAVTVVQMLLKQAGREEYGILVVLAGLTLALIKTVPLVLDLFSEVEAVMHWLP